MKRTSFFWGLVLIFFGFAFLAGNLLQINMFALFWPLFLILLGVWVIFGNTLRRKSLPEEHSVPLEGAAAGRIKIGHGAGHLRVDGSAPSGMLLSGTFGGGLDMNRKEIGDAAEVNLSVPPIVWPFGWAPGDSLDWDLHLSREIPLEIEFNTGAGENRIDLSGTMLTNLIFKTGASSTKIVFPSSPGTTRARIEGGAASVDLIIPPDSAARIRVQSGLSGINVDPMRFDRQGNEYISEGYHTSPNKLDIDVSMGVGSVSVR